MNPYNKTMKTAKEESMKISKQTLSILKNFASINQSIVIKAGTRLQTISNVKDIFASATVTETFPVDVAIYDLNQFLAIVGLFEDPDFEFTDNSVTISEGGSTQTFFYADQSVIVTPPEKGVTLPSIEVKGNLTKEQLSAVTRAAAANGASDLTFTNGDLKVHEKAVPNSNSFSIGSVADHNADYELTITVEKLKMLADDYEFEICAKGLSRFNGANGVEYFVALQPDGKYGS